MPWSSPRQAGLRSSRITIPTCLLPKVGMRWQPIDEQPTIRSTWGEGFREPSLIELFASPTFGLEPTTLNGVSEPETATESSSNPHLQPEDSRSWSGGIVYTPKWIPTRYGSVTLSVDLWDIERRGVVVSPPAQEVVKRFEKGINAGGDGTQLAARRRG